MAIRDVSERLKAFHDLNAEENKIRELFPRNQPELLGAIEEAGNVDFSRDNLSFLIYKLVGIIDNLNDHLLCQTELMSHVIKFVTVYCDMIESRIEQEPSPPLSADFLVENLEGVVTQLSNCRDILEHPGLKEPVLNVLRDYRDYIGSNKEYITLSQRESLREIDRTLHTLGGGSFFLQSP
jgi:hypothetical protein